MALICFARIWYHGILQTALSFHSNWCCIQALLSHFHSRVHQTLCLEADDHPLWHSVKGNMLSFFFLSKCKLTALKKKKKVKKEEYLVLIPNCYFQQSWISLVVSVISLLTSIKNNTLWKQKTATTSENKATHLSRPKICLHIITHTDYARV